MNPTALQRLGRVKQARQFLEEARQRLDAALLAQGPSPDNVIITPPLLALLWDAVAARRHLRRMETAAHADGWVTLADDHPSVRSRSN